MTQFTGSADRSARIEAGQVVCPWCECSDEISYAEDVTVRHPVKVIADSIRVCPEHSIDDQPFDERIHCETCGTSSSLPAGVAIFFERFTRSCE